MKMRILTGLAICAALAAAHPAFTQDKPGNQTNIKPIRIELSNEPALVLGAMKITLGQAIEWAVKQNFDMLSTSYDVAMVDTQYNQFLKKFAPVLSGEVAGSYAKNTLSQSLFMGSSLKQNKASASLYKYFSSGTTLVAGLNYQYDDVFRGWKTDYFFSKMGATSAEDVLGPAKAYKPSIFVSVQQELLKNTFGYNDRLLEQIFKNGAKMQKEAIIFQLSIVIVQVIGEYWNTVIGKVSLENADLQVKETRKVRDITARNAGYGLADDYTLNYYNSLLAGAEAKVAMTRQKYIESLRSFLTTINVDEKTEVTGTAVFSNRYPAVNVDEALKTAYNNRADYRIARSELETAKLAVKVASNNMLPSLTASFVAKSNSESGKFGGNSVALGQVFGLQYPSYEGKIKLTYPIGDNDAYVQERNARFRLKQTEIQFDKYTRKVKDDVMNSTDNIETAYKVYQKAMEARRQSEFFYQGMLANLRRGKIASSVAKNGLDALVQSREMELQALVGYNISLLQFDVARNVLFEKYNIDIEKYIPKDKKGLKN
jgi:outer membrane protein TolC